MASSMLETWQQWIESAREDLRLAKVLLEEQHDFYPPICFHSQQAVEKTLKAFLYFHRIDEEFRGHHLETLLARCKEIDSAFKEFEMRCGKGGNCLVLTGFWGWCIVKA